MTILATYSIDNIEALLALETSQRIDGYARLVKSEANWYMFSAIATTEGLIPDDNPPVGRWIKISGGASPIKIINSNYTAKDGDRILVVLDFSVDEDITIILPLNPHAGCEIEILYRNDYGYPIDSEAEIFYPDVEIDTNGESFMGRSNFSRIALTRTNYSSPISDQLGGKIVYVSADIGWYVLPPGNNGSFFIGTFGG